MTWTNLILLFHMHAWCQQPAISPANVVCDFNYLLRFYSWCKCIGVLILSSLYVCMAIKHIIVLFVETPRKFITAEIYVVFPQTKLLYVLILLPSMSRASRKWILLDHGWESNPRPTYFQNDAHVIFLWWYIMTWANFFLFHAWCQLLFQRMLYMIWLARIPLILYI